MKLDRAALEAAPRRLLSRGSRLKPAVHRVELPDGRAVRALACAECGVKFPSVYQLELHENHDASLNILEPKVFTESPSSL